MRKLFFFGTFLLISCSVNYSDEIPLDQQSKQNEKDKSEEIILNDTLFHSANYQLEYLRTDEYHNLIYRSNHITDTLFQGEIYHCDNIFGYLRKAVNDFFIWENGSCGSGNRDWFYVFDKDGTKILNGTGLVFCDTLIEKVIYAPNGNLDYLYCTDFFTSMSDSIPLSSNQFMDYKSLEITKEGDKLFVTYDNHTIGAFNK